MSGLFFIALAYLDLHYGPHCGGLARRDAVPSGTTRLARLATPAAEISSLHPTKDNRDGINLPMEHLRQIASLDDEPAMLKTTVCQHCGRHPFAGQTSDQPHSAPSADGLSTRYIYGYAFRRPGSGQRRSRRRRTVRLWQLVDEGIRTRADAPSAPTPEEIAAARRAAVRRERSRPPGPGAGLRDRTGARPTVVVAPADASGRARGCAATRSGRPDRRDHDTRAGRTSVHGDGPAGCPATYLPRGAPR